MMRNKRSAKVATGVMVAALLVLGVVGNVIPALATHVDGSVSVDIKETLSGQGVTSFTFTVNHPVPVDPDPIMPGSQAVITPLNSIVVQSPNGFVVEPAGNTAPHAGWGISVVKIGAQNRTVRYTLGTGNGVGADSATATQTFVVKAAVPTPAAEVTSGNFGQWRVQVSSDGGADTREPTPANTLTKVRVLKVMDVALTAPAGVTDGSVTGAQGTRPGPADDITARCSVKNFASVPHTITPVLGGSNFSVEQAAAPQTLAAGATGDFLFRLSFADVGSQVSGNAITCNATSVNGTGGQGSTPTGFNGQIGVTIQPRAIFTYVNAPGNFFPRAKKPGDTASFTTVVAKTPANSPVVNLNAAATNFSLLHKDGSGVVVYGPQAISSSSTIGGGVQTVSMQFAEAVISGSLANGLYPGRLNIAGTDANDALVEFVPVSSFTEKVRLDNLIPVIDSHLTPLAKPLNFGSDTTDVPRAVKNGASLPFTGTVKDTNPDSGELEPCGPPVCTIQSAFLHQFAGFEGGAEIGTPIAVSPSLSSGGNIGGSYSGNYPAPGVKSIQLEINVVDEAGNPVGDFSDNTADADNQYIPVDLELPKIMQAAITRTIDETTQAERRNTIVVRLDECITPTSTNRDWTVEGNLVQLVGAAECIEADPLDPIATQYGFEGRVKLTLLSDMADDGPYGILTYDPSCPVGCSQAAGKFQDRVSVFITTPAPKDIIDRIAPLTPVIDSIRLGARSFGLQDNAYWSNIDAPVFKIVNAPGPLGPTGQASVANRSVRSGYKIEIWQETNLVGGIQRAGGNPDSKLGSKVVQDADGDTLNDCKPPMPGEAEKPCTTLVTANFVLGDASDTSTSDNAHTLYVVSLDTPTPPNVSVARVALAEIDKIVPEVLFSETTFGTSTVTVAFNDSVVRGRNGNIDWLLYDADENPATFSAVQNGTSSAFRELTGGSNYPSNGQDGVLYFGYNYAGPAGQRYEDRATNPMADNDRCLRLLAGSGICPA